MWLFHPMAWKHATVMTCSVVSWLSAQHWWLNPYTYRIDVLTQKLLQPRKGMVNGQSGHLAYQWNELVFLKIGVPQIIQCKPVLVINRPFFWLPILRNPLNDNNIGEHLCEITSSGRSSDFAGVDIEMLVDVCLLSIYPATCRGRRETRKDAAQDELVSSLMA